MKRQNNTTTEKLVNELISQANPSEIFSKEGLFNQLKKQIIERMLNSELDLHLGYSKHSKQKKHINNRRNGSYPKTIIDSNGEKLSIDIPREFHGISK